MNANELTALIGECLRETDDHEFFLKLESVLRQQQSEIEALKAGKIRAYNNGVEDGRKPDTNNKPVAWMETYKGEPNNLDWDKSNLNYGSEFHDVVPLYTHPVKEQYKFGVDWSKDGNAVTVLKICEDGVAEVVFMDYQEATHPVKELTDKEIEEIAKEFKDVDYTLDEEEAFDVFNHRGFARAILRKAQEK